MPLLVSTKVAAKLATEKPALVQAIKAALVAEEGRSSDDVAQDIADAVGTMIENVINEAATELQTWGTSVTSWANSHMHATAAMGPPSPGLPPLV